MESHTNAQNFALLIGRVLFSLLFIIAGFGKIIHFQENVAYIASQHVPFPMVATVLAIIFELGGSLLILIGWQARLGGAMIAVFTIIATLLVHHFWTYPDPEARNQLLHFMKNITILGGAVYIMVVGAGSYQLHRHTPKPQSQPQSHSD